MSNWDERQRAMLEAMGLRVWQKSAAPSELPAAHEVPAPAAAAPLPAERSEPPLARPAAAPPSLALPPAMPPRSAAAVSAPAGPVAQMGWDELRSAVAGCRACGLCEGRKNTVFGVGNEQAHWMIVGEAPGEQEDQQGEPFVGQAGKLLDSMLRAIQLKRAPGTPEQQVFIANTLKCRPPRNRNPEPQELAQCAPFLERQIALVQPRIILAMGRFAVQSLLQSNEAIGRLRGRVHDYQGIPVIVTYHPAYLLRNLLDKARAWEDLCLALDTVQLARPR
jgi:DNA polymerase